ncbi:MAG: DUF4430 domain-containing protein [Clostridia bacterium]|nr:DUF4430 domain-containing protein [Clostridia bacterium]
MKNTKRILVILAAVMLLALTIPVLASAATKSEVTLRIEGVTKNLFYGKVALSESVVTVADVIVKADEDNESLTVVGADTGYISAVNGEAGGQFGGWDGWMYRVNGVEAAVGISEYTLKAGDEIVLFYGDPFGVGMQYPEIDLSDVEDGIIRFTSVDTTYDIQWNPVETVNPVAGATVTFDGKTFTTDEKGEITVDEALLAEGEHKVAIEKYSENGIPLVLRFAPDFTVVIEDEPLLGDSGAEIYVIIAAAAVIAVIAIVKTRRVKA